jgi:hypothetical protein
MRASSLGQSSIGLSCFVDGEPAGFHPHFLTRHGRNLIKGLLASLRIPQCSLPQREPSELYSHLNLLRNDVLQHPLLFRRCHYLGQWCHSRRNPALGLPERAAASGAELPDGQLVLLRLHCSFLLVVGE